MIDPRKGMAFLAVALCAAAACSTNYEKGQGKSPTVPQYPESTDSITAGTPAAKGAQQRFENAESTANTFRADTLRPAPDSCVSTDDIQFREGFTYRRGVRFTGVACSYYEAGELHTATGYADGRRAGPWAVYYANGVVEKRGVVRSGVEDGTYVENYINGQRRYEYHYDMGTKTGVWRSWYADGGRYTERHFQNGMLHGKVLVWDEHGRLAKEYDYVHGKLIHSDMHFKDWE